MRGGCISGQQDEISTVRGRSQTGEGACHPGEQNGIRIQHGELRTTGESPHTEKRARDLNGQLPEEDENTQTHLLPAGSQGDREQRATGSHHETGLTTPGDRGGGAWGVAGRAALEPPDAARGVGLRAPLGPALHCGVYPGGAGAPRTVGGTEASSVACF